MEKQKRNLKEIFERGKWSYSFESRFFGEFVFRDEDDIIVGVYFADDGEFCFDKSYIRSNDVTIIVSSDDPESMEMAEFFLNRKIEVSISGQAEASAFAMNFDLQ